MRVIPVSQSRRFRGLTGLALLLLANQPAVGSAAELADIDGRHWLKLTAPGLVIISDASEAQLRRSADEIEVFRRGLQLTLPVTPAESETPATIFLFHSGGAIKPFLPLVDGKRGRAAAFFNSVLGHDLGAVSLGSSRFESREQIYHELTHWHLQRTGIAVPLWLEEGLAQVYESFTIDGGKLRLGHVREGQFRHVRIAGTPPLEPLLRTDELDFSQAGFKHGRTDLFYAESWALTHMLAFGTYGGISQVCRYLDALRQGLEPEAAFSAGFGLTVADAHARLDTYIRSTRLQMLQLPIDRTSLPPHTVVPISGAELDAQAALLLVAAGQKVPAQQLISRLLQQTPADAVAWELQAAVTLEPGQLPEGSTLGALARAYQHGSRNPAICCLLGFAGLSGELPAATGADALTLFRAALKARAGFPQAYQGIAYLALQEEGPSAAMRADVVAGHALSPASPVLNLAMAHLEIIDRKRTEAQSRLSRLLVEHPDLPYELRTLATHLMATAAGRSP
jgi:hypothetical protein